MLLRIDALLDDRRRVSEAFRNHALLETYKSIRNEIIELETKLLGGMISSAATLVVALVVASVALTDTSVADDLKELLPFALMGLGVVSWGMFITLSILTVEMLRLGWAGFNIEQTLNLGETALEHQTWIKQTGSTGTERSMSNFISKTQEETSGQYRYHRLCLIVVIWIVLSGGVLGLMVGSGTHLLSDGGQPQSWIWGCSTGLLGFFLHYFFVRFLRI
ncbi:MAG: hypothetical protein IH944_12170 [Armatimonadetes bacterium]|nr:hypothetical protein [Armatimonadota bacterium]